MKKLNFYLKNWKKLIPTLTSKRIALATSLVLMINLLSPYLSEALLDAPFNLEVHGQMEDVLEKTKDEFPGQTEPTEIIKQQPPEERIESSSSIEPSPTLPSSTNEFPSPTPLLITQPTSSIIPSVSLTPFPTVTPALTSTPTPTTTPNPTVTETPSSVSTITIVPTPTETPTVLFTPTLASSPSPAEPTPASTSTLPILIPTPIPSPTFISLASSDEPTIAIRPLTKRHFRKDERIEVVLTNAENRLFTVKLTHASGEKGIAQVTETTVVGEKILKIFPSASFRPGKYTLQVIDSQGRTSAQDFTWGVLAINTNKSIYSPNEKAKISIAVLNEQGYVVCDAKLVLKIESEKAVVSDELSTENGTITSNPECLKHQFSFDPDYQASYQVGGVGQYQMTLSAQTKNGTYTISDAFEVRESVPFDVERNTATRIYPPEDYPVTLSIKANQDFEGTIEETVPGSFAVSSLEEERITPYSSVTTHQIETDNTQVLGATIPSLRLPFDGESSITIGFGERYPDGTLAERILNRFGLRSHDGIDFDMPVDTPIYAVDEGEIEIVENDSDGLTLVITHSWGKSYYEHLNKITVTEGEKVSKGQAVAFSGNSGISTGPHLHFSIQPRDSDPTNGYHGKVDPSLYLGLAKEGSVPPAQTASSQVKVISWPISIKEGETLTLGYRFKAPDVSPQFYLLGPLRFVSIPPENLGPTEPTLQNIVFEEIRQWQIAADALGERAMAVTIPRPTHTMTTEKVGGTDAHILIINQPGSNPDYKWQFLTNGVKVLIDRKDVSGWQPLIAEIRSAPEYMKQQGSEGSFVWRPYGLNINTNGGNVLQGFDRQDQPDGSVKLARTYSTTEEGVAETLTETWTIPANTEDLAKNGPKNSHQMTKNRGIVLTKGVEEGTWRMRWALSGIADISADSPNLVDTDGWPIRHKSYSNNEFTIDVNDFDNLQNNINAFTFSEIGQNNKAEILFSKDGTTGDRVVDPTVVTANIATAWKHNKQRNVQYNGSYFFVFYNKGSTSLFAKSATTVGGLASASEQTALNAVMVSNTEWDIYWVNDSKFDIAYISGTDTFKVQTCTVNGSGTIDCTTLAASAAQGSSGDDAISVARTPSGSSTRIWVTASTTTTTTYFSAAQTGDSNSVTSWNNEGSGSSIGEVTIIPYGSSDKILGIRQHEAGGSANDGIYSDACDQTICSSGSIIKGSSLLQNPIRFGNGARLSDSDFRYVLIDASDILQEYKFDGSSWSNLATIASTGTPKNPSLMYHRSSGDLYAFYADSNDDIWYQKKTNGGSWGSAVNADNDEADANSLPVTQMVDPPHGSSRESPTELVWGYRNINGSNYDVVVGNLNIDVTKIYTREAKTSLPSNDADLGTVYTSTEITNVGTADDTRVSQAATSAYPIHLYKYQHSNSSDNITISWEGQTNTSNGFIYLQIYNLNTSTWETLQSKGPPPDTYYFDTSDGGPYDPDGTWTLDTRAFDGNTGTFAHSDAYSTWCPDIAELHGEGTNAPASGATINSVRARIFAGGTLYSLRLSATIYTDALSQTLGTATVNTTPPAWGNYANLSQPSGGWSYSVLQALETKICMEDLAGGGGDAARVEIEVSYGASNYTINTDFTLAGTISVSPGNYYATNNWVSARVYQDSGTETLQTDQISFSFSSSGPTNDQLLRHGNWFNSSGVEQSFTF